MASPTWWTWVWASSGSWWWTGKPGMLQSMGLQRVEYDWVTELNWHTVLEEKSLDSFMDHPWAKTWMIGRNLPRDQETERHKRPSAQGAQSWRNGEPREQPPEEGEWLEEKQAREKASVCHVHMCGVCSERGKESWNPLKVANNYVLERPSWQSTLAIGARILCAVCICVHALTPEYIA